MVFVFIPLFAAIEGTWEGSYVCSGEPFMLMSTLKKSSLTGDITGTLSFANSSINAVLSVQAKTLAGSQVVFIPLGFKVQVS